MPGIHYIETLLPTLELFTRARGFNEFLKYALAGPPNVNDVESMTQFRSLRDSIDIRRIEITYYLFPRNYLFDLGAVKPN